MNILWHKFPDRAPKKNGTYLCTIEFEYAPGKWQSYVIDLYWDGDAYNIRNRCLGKWIDKRRVNMFDTYRISTYDAYQSNQYRVVHTDDLCNRTDHVIAWRRMPKEYVSARIKQSKEIPHEVGIITNPLVPISRAQKLDVSEDFDMSTFYPAKFVEYNTNDAISMQKLDRVSLLNRILSGIRGRNKHS